VLQNKVLGILHFSTFSLTEISRCSLFHFYFLFFIAIRNLDNELPASRVESQVKLIVNGRPFSSHDLSMNSSSLAKDPSVNEAGN